MTENFTDPTLLALQQLALSLPEVVEAGACVKRAFKVGKKSFLFLGEKTGEINMMVKLGPSIREAEKLAGAGVVVGKGRWVTVKLAPGDDLPNRVLGNWVEESYREQAPKRLLS